MINALNADTVQVFLAFVVPGIIVVYFRSLFLTGRMPPIGEGIAAYLTVSLVYHAASFGILLGNTQSDVLLIAEGWHWPIFVFLLPAAIGVLSGLNGRHGWIASIFARARANTVHPIECAWDWKFSNCSESWVRLKLIDGTEWAGVLGTSSFLSSNPAERDLYLERVYFLNADESWTEKSSSVWISHNSLQSIELWPKS